MFGIGERSEWRLEVELAQELYKGQLILWVNRMENKESNERLIELQERDGSSIGVEEIRT